MDVWVWWVRTVGSYCFRLVMDGNYWEVCEFVCALLAALPLQAGDRWLWLRREH